MTRCPFIDRSDKVGSHERVKMPILAEIPSIKEIRTADRMPLDCARDIIYAIAKEMQELERSVPFFSGFDRISYHKYDFQWDGLHDHLFRLIMRLVIKVEPGPDGIKETSLDEDLHNYENLYYITLCHICMLYRELHREFSAGRVDPNERFTEHLTAKTMVKHLYSHWSALVDPVLMATLDFSIRKKQLMDFKTMHNMAVFNGSRNYDHDRDLKSIENSIRKGLNAVPFDESQLFSGKYKGLTPELFDDQSDFVHALLQCLYRRHTDKLGYWFFDNKTCAGCYWAFRELSEEDGLALNNSLFDPKRENLADVPAPEIHIPEENVPRPVDFSKVCAYLSEGAGDVEMEDPFSEAAASLPTPPTSTSRKRGRCPSPVDTALANGGGGGSGKRPRRRTPEPSPAPPSAASHLTGVSRIVSPRWRRAMSVLPSPVLPGPGEAAVVPPALTRARHDRDAVVNGEMMRAERERAMRALCGEETEEDEERRYAEAMVVMVEEEVARTWRELWG
ncbi:hypothetical protein SLS58_003711 [Diplodia intermedia]|uniref:Uncharacterized protein n=1 Tax=Diplodia intermedia TaxID=856260 RepID=A0ABR3TV41_9PEZI